MSEKGPSHSARAFPSRVAQLDLNQREGRWLGHPGNATPEHGGGTPDLPEGSHLHLPRSRATRVADLVSHRLSSEVGMAEERCSPIHDRTNRKTLTDQQTQILDLLSQGAS